MSTTYTWTRGLSQPGSVSQSSIEWVETWVVIGYSHTPGEVGWITLLADRPDLARGQPHQTVPGAFVDQFEADRLEASNAWEARVRYRFIGAESPDENPLDQPARISVDWISEPEATTRWADGTPILNTAGDLILHERPARKLVFNVEKNVAGTPAWLVDYADAVNSDVVELDGLEFQPGYLKLENLKRGDRQSALVGSSTVYYYVLSFSLVYNPRGWETKIHNRGLYQINDELYPDGGHYGPCVDDEGEPVTEPQFLSAAGKQLTHPVDTESIVTVDGWDYELKPFNALPLT